jgi:ribosome biogenesis GTPase A
MAFDKRKTSEPIKLTPDTPPKSSINWYPGHMVKALQDIRKRLKMVDIVLEIRDARVPLVSGNRSIDEMIGQKSRLILLNKVNLADPEKIAKWEEWFKAQGQPYLFVNCFDKPVLKKVISMARKIVEDKRLECNPEMTEQKEKLKLMILGLPNTGKSTIINQLANRTVAKVADLPGLTRVQQWISLENDIDLLDTPGVLPPQIDKEEHGLWLSAIHAIPDGIVGEEDPACYLVKHFLKIKSQAFQERYKLISFDMTIDEVFLQIAVVRGCIKQKGLPDLERVHKIVLQDFRQGDLGKCCFGTPPSK